MSRNTASFIFPLLIALFLGSLYFQTMAPGLTWANDGADGGDLIAAVATGGVPHPTGYPTYLAIASVALKIPLGSLAFRANLLSSICTVITALVIYRIVAKLEGNTFSASLASLAFGAFPLVWSQAIITEVNAVNALFSALIVYFLLVRKTDMLADLTGGVVFGLGMGAHVTNIFLIPLLFVSNLQPALPHALWKTKERFLPYIKLLLRRFAGLLLGINIYWLVPIRARSQSPVNWGDAVDWEGFSWLVTGRMYQSRLEHFSGSYLWSGLQAWARLLVEQMGVLGLVLVFVALAFVFKPSRLYLFTTWMALVYSAFSILYYSPDSYVYLIPVLMALSIWVGLAGGWIVEWASRRAAYLKPVTILVILSLLVARAVTAIPRMDLSTDRRAEQYARAVLDAAPPGAILITAGDEATFSLWYFHYAYRQRPDVAVVCRDLMSQPWYRRVLQYTYPDLVVPVTSSVEDVIVANSDRPACRLGPDLEPRIECASQENAK